MSIYVDRDDLYLQCNCCQESTLVAKHTSSRMVAVMYAHNAGWLFKQKQGKIWHFCPKCVRYEGC